MYLSKFALLTLSSPNHQDAGRPANSWKRMYKYDRRAKLELQNTEKKVINLMIMFVFI